MNEDSLTFSSLDPSQKHAFNSIINDDSNIQIVYGPPGTGKSQLVVSLLARLAGDNKKVLFVSQNTEALRVIERMIKRTEDEIGYPNDSRYLSLLDFCLMLHNPAHRHLKYLREQYSKLNGKQLPDVYTYIEPAYINYPLSYTQLDHNKNYNIKDDKIGFDELVGYRIKYVKRSMAPESLREFENIKVRDVFNELDNYSYKDYFSEFNKPRRELILLSTKNSNIVLPDIREQINNLVNAFKSKGEFLTMFTTKNDLDVVDYLVLLQKYNQAINYLDIYRIATENKKISELSESIKQFIDSQHNSNIKLQKIDDLIHHISNKAKSILTIDSNVKKITLNNNAIDIAENNLNDVIKDCSRIPELIKEIISTTPDVKYSSLLSLQIAFTEELKCIFNETITLNRDCFYKITSDDIEDLNTEIEKYYLQSTVKRLISGVPKIFRSLLNIDSTKQLDLYRDKFVPILDAIKDIIKIDGATIKQLFSISNKKSAVGLSRFGIKSSKKINVIRDRIAPIYELHAIVKKYDAKQFSNDFKEFESWFHNFNDSIAMLDNLRTENDNKKAFLSEKLSDFIKDANIAIEIRDYQNHKAELLEQQKKTSYEFFSENSKWLLNTEDVEALVARAREIYEYLSLNESSICKLIEQVSLPDNNMVIDADLSNLIEKVNEVNQLDLFSDFFFEIKKEKTLIDWLNNISILTTYSNDSEIVDFIEHNKSINNIRRALGDANSKYLDDILNNDVTFEIFAGRLVNVLVSEIFGRSSLNSKKHVSTKDLVDAYDNFLKSQKAQNYKESLNNIHSNTLNATRLISRQSILQVGGVSTMEKFRNNTTAISDAFPIICATPKEVSKYIAADKAIFDFVIFDESSQLLPGQALPSIYRAKKAVIIGDPHQMPPSLNASIGITEVKDDDFDDLGESILDLLRKQPQKQHHLKVHYRSKYNKLFEPSREAIYSQDGIEPIFEAELSPGAPIEIEDNLGDVIDEFGYDKNFQKICESIDFISRNNKDATFCVLFTTLAKLNDFKKFLAEIGERVQHNVSNMYDGEKILLSTVTNCQGIEGTYSIIYLHHYSSPGAMWFFKETAGAYKRLNVSITRQREGIKLLLADPRSRWLQVCQDKLNNSSSGPNTLKSAELMKSLLQNAGEVTDITYLDRKLAGNVNNFDSPLTKQLYDKLCDYYNDKIGRTIKIYSEVGWNLLIPTGEAKDANERNVGFRIDLGIFSVRHKKFILGIEMDGAMYHTGYDKEQSDYNRQKILEEKGWTLYRIWSTNWLNDGDRELSNLIKTINQKIL